MFKNIVPKNFTNFRLTNVALEVQTTEHLAGVRRGGNTLLIGKRIDCRSINNL